MQQHLQTLRLLMLQHAAKVSDAWHGCISAASLQGCISQGLPLCKGPPKSLGSFFPKGSNCFLLSNWITPSSSIGGPWTSPSCSIQISIKAQTQSSCSLHGNEALRKSACAADSAEQRYPCEDC